jgi:CubicO group peptidase (beta-lactamase class C family)
LALLIKQELREMRKKSPIILLLLIIISCIIVRPITSSNGSTDETCLPLFEPQVDDQILEIMEQVHIPTVTTAVIRNNSIIWAKGYGEQQELDLIYPIGSVTKTFTATAIFKLFEEEVIRLYDDVNDYLPFSFRHPNHTDIPITIKMLLQHTSGLRKESDMYWNGVMSEALQDLGWENPYEWASYPYWIEEHLTPNGSLYDPNVWSANAPGTVRTYSNFGYDVLGYLVWCITGQPIWDYHQNNIFDPLGMDCTGYNYTDFELSQLAIPYIYMFELDPNSTGNDAYPHYSNFNYGAGGLRLNIYDLAKFLLVFLQGGVSNGTRILEETTLMVMENLQTAWLSPDDPLIAWGGWGGTEGDSWAFHTKGYGYYDGNTTVPYGVITFLNQGADNGRDACFNITMLLANYVHEYDQLECVETAGFTFIISVSSFTALMLLIASKRQKSKQKGT